MPAVAEPVFVAERGNLVSPDKASSTAVVVDIQDVPTPREPSIAAAEHDVAEKSKPVSRQRHAIMPSPPKPVTLPAAEPDLVEKLRQELEERDAAIASLLQRVERLERILTPTELDQAVAGALGGAPSAAGLPSLSPQRPPLASEPPPAEPGNRPGGKSQAQATTPPGSVPGQFEVDEDELDRALERTLVEEGALLLPFGRAEIDPTFEYTRREQDVLRTRRNEFEGDLTLRVGLPFDSQVNFSLPYRYVQQSQIVGGSEDDREGSGLGGFGLSLAKTLLREDGWWPDLIGRVSWDSDTGKRTHNGVILGGGFNDLRGSLTALKRQDPLAFLGSVSYEYSFEENDVRPGEELGFSVGAFLAASPQTSLRFLLNQSFEDDATINGQVIDGSDQVSSTMTIGAAAAVGAGVLVDVSADIGLTEDAPDYAARISVPVRFDLPIPK